MAAAAAAEEKGRREVKAAEALPLVVDSRYGEVVVVWKEFKVEKEGEEGDETG